MTQITINVDELVKVLTKALNQDMGTVPLIPGTIMGIKYDPSALPAAPSIMSQPELVPSIRYRFGYYDFRYMLFGYLLERNGNYESGEFEVISNAPENDPKSDVFIPPTLYTRKYVKSITGSIGAQVELGVDYDSTVFSSTGNHQFGITYRITTNTAGFPYLRMFMINVLGTKEP